MKFSKIIFVILPLMLMQGCDEKDTVNLGRGYRFDYDLDISNDYVIFGPHKNTYAVSGDVLKFDYDSIFIIAEQKPRDIILKEINKNNDLNFDEEEKIFKQSLFRQYWIINKTNNNKYGPFKKEEFIQKRIELGVSVELKLKE